MHIMWYKSYNFTKLRELNEVYITKVLVINSRGVLFTYYSEQTKYPVKTFSHTVPCFTYTYVIKVLTMLCL